MKRDRSEPGNNQDKLRQRLRDRLSLNNIHAQIQLISRMNKQLQISIEAFMKLDILANLSREELIAVVRGIPFIKHVHKSQRTLRQCFQLQYENSNRILLLTGIQVQFIENILTKFNSYARKYGDLQKIKGTLAKITMNTPFWVGIEAVNEEAANSLKKFLRNEKRNLDQVNQKLEYKVQNRRIRIIIVKEDLFTLLVDAMTEHKQLMSQFRALLFHQQFQFGSLPIDPNKIGDRVIYRPIIYNSAQNYSYRTQTREQELSDGFSESNSLNSDLFDPNKIKDIIETSDQGIQSQTSVSALVIPTQEPTFYEPPRAQSSPLKNPKELKNDQQQFQTLEKQRKHQEQILLRSQIIKSNQDEFGLCQEQVERQYESPKARTLQTYDVCTEKISPIYNKHEISNQQVILGLAKVNLAFDSATQTQQPLYNIIPDHLMRKCLQQFKSKPHSQLIEMPEWLKSQSQNERNRHRFFSSLCKPKLIHRHHPF